METGDFDAPAVPLRSAGAFQLFDFEGVKGAATRSGRIIWNQAYGTKQINCAGPDAIPNGVVGRHS